MFDFDLEEKKTQDSIWMKPQLCEVGKILDYIPMQFKEFHFRMFLVGSLPKEKIGGNP